MIQKLHLRAPYIIKVLNEKIADNAVITLDVGEHCWWFGRNFWMKKSQKMVMSGYLATMGFGLPAALASQILYPDRQVDMCNWRWWLFNVNGRLFNRC